MTGTSPSPSPPKLAFLGLIMIGFARTAVEVSGFAPPKIAARTESTWSLQQIETDELARTTYSIYYTLRYTTIDLRLLF